MKNIPKSDGDNFRPEYEKEGFISDDIYRVVIVAPREGPSVDIDAVRSNAKMRALSSLQKYLMSNERILDQNTNAHLLSIIESSGSLKEAHSGNTRLVYYFDIQRPGLRGHISRITKKR